MRTNYQYPLDFEWTAEEIVQVTTFYRAVEDAYELPQGIKAERILKAYDGFKTVVASMAQEKQLDRKFKQITGYSLYLTVKAAQKKRQKSVKMPD